MISARGSLTMEYICDEIARRPSTPSPFVAPVIQDTVVRNVWRAMCNITRVQLLHNHEVTVAPKVGDFYYKTETFTCGSGRYSLRIPCFGFHDGFITTYNLDGTARCARRPQSGKFAPSLVRLPMELVAKEAGVALDVAHRVQKDIWRFIGEALHSGRLIDIDFIFARVLCKANASSTTYHSSFLRDVYAIDCRKWPIEAREAGEKLIAAFPSEHVSGVRPPTPRATSSSGRQVAPRTVSTNATPRSPSASARQQQQPSAKLMQKPFVPSAKRNEMFCEKKTAKQLQDEKENRGRSATRKGQKPKTLKPLMPSAGLDADDELLSMDGSVPYPVEGAPPMPHMNIRPQSITSARSGASGVNVGITAMTEEESIYSVLTPSRQRAADMAQLRPASRDAMPVAESDCGVADEYEYDNAAYGNAAYGNAAYENADDTYPIEDTQEDDEGVVATADEPGTCPRPTELSEVCEDDVEYLTADDLKVPLSAHSNPNPRVSTGYSSTMGGTKEFPFNARSFGQNSRDGQYCTGNTGLQPGEGKLRSRHYDGQTMRALLYDY